VGSSIIRFAASNTIEYSERLAEAVIEPSAGSVGDSYDDALAGMIRASMKRIKAALRATGSRAAGTRHVVAGRAALERGELPQ